MTETNSGAVAMIPVPEPNLTPAELIARAEAMIPMLREQQEDAEARGYYSEEVHREFVRAGFSRCLQPRRFGGYEFDLGTFLRVMVNIATGDPGTGWCLALASSHAFVVGSYFAAGVQAEAYGPDGDFRCSHPVAPVGMAAREAKGWRVSGTAHYASGIPYATWTLCNALVPSQNGGPPQPIVMLVPRRNLTMLDNWGAVNGFTLGMNSSGSNSFVLENVFVPDGFWQPFDWFEGAPRITPGFELHGNPMYLGRIAGPYHATIALPIVGAARAALDDYVAQNKERRTTFHPMVPRLEFHEDQRAYGLALAMTDAAEAILYAFADQFTEATRRFAAGEPTLSVEQDARWWAMLQQAGGLAAGAVETLTHRAQSGMTGKNRRLGRYFRDATMYRQHISSQQSDFAIRNAALMLGASGTWLFPKAAGPVDLSE